MSRMSRWLTVIPENPQGPTTEDLQFPTSYKLQELLLSRLTQGQIHVRLYEALQCSIHKKL